MSQRRCRSCGGSLDYTFADLGTSPISNSFLTTEQLAQPDVLHPLHVRVCECCFLAQIEQFDPPERLFADYPYFSSYSDSWLRHAEAYTVSMIPRLALGSQSLVVEIASNDGYLLQYFRRAGVPVLGVEPAKNVAKAAENAGVPTLTRFFGRAVAHDLVESGRSADLIVANNVLAHVPDLNDFVAGLKMLLKPHGVITVEFPHLLRLMQEVQFDTIYHEHFSYFSLLAVEPLLERHRLRVIDVEELPTHGGSLRIFVRHTESDSNAVSSAVIRLRNQEKAFGLNQLATYAGFGTRIIAVKDQLLQFLRDAKQKGKKVAGYGAPAKATTLLNYCGIRSDLLTFTVDRSPHKQGRFIPGVRIPVFSPEHLIAEQPDYVLILPWNLKSEIIMQMDKVHSWGGKFVVPIPHLEVLP